MKFISTSIKWKVGVMLLSMVTIPTLSLGLLTYFTFKNEANRNIRGELSDRAHDWEVITKTYVQQEQRVLKREKTLAELRLKTLALHVESMLESTAIDRGAFSEQVLSLIDEIEIGRSGYIFLLDQDGSFLFPKNEGTEKFTNAHNAEGQNISAELLQKAIELRGDQTYTVSYLSVEKGFDVPREQLVVFSYSEELNVIVGAVSYYSDFQSNDLLWILQDELRTIMADQVIKTNGYVWAVNSEGEYLVSKNKLRDGENILNIQDQNGTYNIQHLIAETKQRSAEEGGKIVISKFPWKNIGESKPLTQLTASIYVPEWDWIIGVSAYEKDYLTGLTRIVFYITLVSLIAIIVGSVISIIFSLYLTRPLKALQKAAQQIRDGDLDHQISNLAQDEVGMLANDLEIMRQQLKTRNEKLEESNASLKQLSTDLTAKNEAVEKLNRFMVDREVKMIELKKELADLKKQKIN